MTAPTAPMAPIARKIYENATAALKSPEVKDKLAQQGVIAIGNTTEEFTGYVKAEIARWGKLVETASIKVK